MWRASGTPRSRRALIRGAAAGAGAAALAPLLAACSSSAGAKAVGAAPTVANPTIVLHFAPNWQGASWNKTALTLNQQWFDTNYTPQNPGVRVLVHNGSVQGDASTIISSSIAGSGFLDVFQDCCQDLVELQAAGILAPLDNYLKQDNIDISIWPAGHISVLTFNGVLQALPAYDGPCVMIYRQDILDQLGLPYPDETWTSDSAVSLWQSCVGKTSTGQLRVGASMFGPDDAFDSGGDWNENMNWWLHGWGAVEMNATRTVPGFNSSQALAMATWVQQNCQSNAIAGRTGFSGPLNTGQCVFKQSGGWELLPAVTTMGTTYKWDILPVPYWPGGQRATFNNIDFYALNSASKYPDQAWTLLKTVCALPDYQRFQMQATLVQPCLLSLWDEWESLVVGTAPLLKNKAISWYADAATGGYAWPDLFFQYQPVGADNLIDTYMNNVNTGKSSPQAGLSQLQQQVAALQATGAAEASLGSKNAAKFPTTGSAIATVPAGI